jgi:hypothetical protein
VPAEDALAGAALDAPKLLDVDVDQLARALAFVALGRLEPEAAELAHPDPGQDPRDVETGRPSNSAISGPVKRTLRDAAITPIACSSVRLATVCGAELRSNRPLSELAR